MKIFSLSGATALWLVFSCLLAGCNRPQSPADSNSIGASERGGAQHQTASPEVKTRDNSLDEAGRIMAEAMKRRETSTPQTPAETLLRATPTPSLGARLRVTGQPFTSFEGRFIVTPPPGFGAFERSTEILSNGNVELHKFRSDFPGGSASVMVGYNDLLEGAASRPPQELLESIRDGALQGMGGTLEKQENLTVEGHPALSFYASVTDQASGEHIYCRWEGILQQRRAYYLDYCTTDKTGPDSPQIQAFFKSFTLLQ